MQRVLGFQFPCPQVYGGMLFLLDISCTFRNDVPGPVLIECRDNADCPPGFGCDADTELCELEDNLKPPTNDFCDSRETLIASESPTPLFGRTVGATHSISGPVIEVDGERYSCNGDAEVPPDSEVGPAPDVFYHLSVRSPVNIDLFLDGSAADFSSALYVVNLPGAICPADLSTLNPILVNGKPLCEYGVKLRARIPMAPEGDYLVVVDGQHVDDAYYGVLYNTKGFFELYAKSYPGDFPPPLACVAATEVAVPTSVHPTTFTVDFSDAPQELRAACGGRGAERVFVLHPDDAVDVTITAGGREGNVDTVLYLLTEQCTDSLAASATSENGTCNDDSKDIPNFGSRLDSTLAANTTYYLVIDSYSAESGSANVTLSVRERADGARERIE